MTRRPTNLRHDLSQCFPAHKKSERERYYISLSRRAHRISVRLKCNENIQPVIIVAAAQSRRLTESQHIFTLDSSVESPSISTLSAPYCVCEWVVCKVHSFGNISDPSTSSEQPPCIAECEKLTYMRLMNFHMLSPHPVVVR